MNYFICSKCGKRKYTRPQRYRKILLERYNGDRQQLKKNYTCQDCKFKAAKRWVLKNTISPSIPLTTTDSKELIIEQTNSYQELQKILLEKVKLLHANGIQHRECREAFYYDVKQILLQYNITDFIINVLHNKVNTITLRGLPFIGTYELKLTEGINDE